MSQYIVTKEHMKFVYGWDHPLQSFYIQIHDLSRPEDDEIVVWMGATADTKLYEVEELVRVAHKHGLLIDHRERVALYQDKDEGR